MSETINTETYQNKSGGGCGKVLLWLFFIALILSCLCCAGLFGTSYYMVSALQKGFVEDPVVAEQKAVEAFGELNLPENIKPHAFLAVKMFGTDFGFCSLYTWKLASADLPAASEESTEELPPAEAAPAEEAADSSANNNGTIIFYSLSDFLKESEKDIIDGFARGFISPNNQNEVTETGSKTIPITIKGTPCDFTFKTLEDHDKKAYLTVSGSFTSNKGVPCNILVIMRGEPSQEIIIDVLENIQK